jgi:hypothetical protein
MSVRKIKKSYISCVGYFKSYKNNKQLAFESILERDFFTILEFDDTVISYEEQPFQIKYDLKGRTTRYTPDVLVTYQNNSQKVFEVKYQNEIDSDVELQHKLSVLTQEIKQQKSLQFEIFTDSNLDNIYLKNCIFLYKYAFLYQNPDIKNLTTAAMTNQQDCISVKEFIESLSTDSIAQLKILPYLWHEIFKNNLLVNMHEKITM